MKALVTHKAQQSHMPAPWIIYPFRTVSILQRQLPVEVQQSWTENYQRSNGQIFVICEIYDHWILLLGQKQQQSDGLSWTFHDGLRQGHLLMVLAEVAQKNWKCPGLGLCGHPNGSWTLSNPRIHLWHHRLGSDGTGLTPYRSG